MSEEISCEVPLPSRARMATGVIFAALSVALLSGALLVASSTSTGARQFFASTSVGIGGFALSFIFLFIWGLGGVVVGKVLASSARRGLGCGAAAGLLGQGAAALAVLVANGAFPFPSLHLAVYAALGAVVTGLFAAAATYYYEEQAFWKALRRLEGQR